MRLLSIIILFLLPAGIYAKDVIVLKKSNGMSMIGSRTEIFEDKTTNLGISDILKQEYSSRFKPSEAEIPLFNVTWSAIWIRMTFTTAEKQNWYLYWGMPSAQYVSLYKISETGIKESKSGLRIPSQERQMLGHSIAFPLDLQPGDTAVYYLRIYDIAPLRAILKTGTLEDFFEMDFKMNFWAGIIYGLMLLMVLYNIFLYFTNKKRVYIFYALFVIMNTTFIAFFSGYMTSFPDPFLLVFIYVPVLFPAGFGIFGLLFTMDFLNTREIVPRMHKIMQIFCYIAAIPLLFCFFGQQRMSIISIQVLGLGLGIICITTGIKVLLKGYKPAKFYVIGFGAYMSGLMILIGADFLGATTEFTSQYTLLVGAAIEAVMLSFAIGDKLNNANREKHLAQVAALRSSQENEKLIREQNVVLEQKVKERTAEINEQKQIIEEKQKEILDSIYYAKRIQYTLLAHEEMLKENLGQHFVLFKPKDIVSGDFYWCTKKNDDFYLAVCDSTGHGVPGAFMSLLNISFLNEAINEKNIQEPHLVLNHVRERLIQNMEGGQDGMDAVLVRFTKGKIQYAAANNHPVLISNGELKELPADKMPVGKGEKKESFNLHEMNFAKGDALYLFTDGYADQFGGPKGKKFKYSNLHQMLLENSKAEYPTQNAKLQQTFESWKGDLEQVDDVCVIGIRI